MDELIPHLKGKGVDICFKTDRVGRQQKWECILTKLTHEHVYGAFRFTDSKEHHLIIVPMTEVDRIIVKNLTEEEFKNV